MGIQKGMALIFGVILPCCLIGIYLLWQLVSPAHEHLAAIAEILIFCFGVLATIFVIINAEDL